MAITSAFQADDAGSIPVIPSKKPLDSKCQGVSFFMELLGIALSGAGLRGGVLVVSGGLRLFLWWVSPVSTSAAWAICTGSPRQLGVKMQPPVDQ